MLETAKIAANSATMIYLPNHAEILTRVSSGYSTTIKSSKGTYCRSGFVKMHFDSLSPKNANIGSNNRLA